MRTTSRSSRRGLSIPIRPARERLLAGVCAGLAQQFGLDPTLVRLAFILLGLAWGIGVILYAALWLLLPDELGGGAEDMRDVVRQNWRGIQVRVLGAQHYLGEAWERHDGARWPRPLTRRWMAYGLIAVGALVLLVSFGAFGWLTPVRAIGLAIVVVGVAAIAGMREAD